MVEELAKEGFHISDGIGVKIEETSFSDDQ